MQIKTMENPDGIVLPLKKGENRRKEEEKEKEKNQLYKYRLDMFVCILCAWLINKRKRYLKKHIPAGVVHFGDLFSYEPRFQWLYNRISSSVWVSKLTDKVRLFKWIPQLSLAVKGFILLINLTTNHPSPLSVSIRVPSTTEYY